MINYSFFNLFYTPKESHYLYNIFFSISDNLPLNVNI